MPALHCPHCRSSVDVHRSDLGHLVRCPDCRGEFEAEYPEPESANGPATWEIRCTACRQQIEIAGDDVGHKIECPHCGERFRAGADPEGLPRHPNRGSPGRRRNRDDEEDEDDRFPRERSQAFLERHRAAILAKARKAIDKPAKGLMWTGAVGTVLFVLAGLSFALAAILTADSPNPSFSVLFFVYSALFGGFGGVYYLILGIAGFQMKKLRSKGWAYVGGAMGIASVFFWGIILPTTWASLAYGIMAIVAVGKREVQDAILLNNLKTRED